ncbi:helix-turn-helix transcriptional regulator [Tateyamaria omphalii]|uniref:winged helix-turn-helix transcriptional regulator n=1 Tax=Tateyamaria omphalii TaxID=299262 RepID=UPI001C996EBE|nr:helix-turn-helix domain-containing protein [Tateyamaria omphalii]MBY5934085.1 helix-turn-helix transcriptional regulator [Tateyamaria omphalii]
MSNSEKGPVREAPVSLTECGAALAIEQVPDRWTWLILREMFYGVSRFADIQTDIGIPKSVLSGRLAQIVENGLAKKEAYRDGSARTRYAYVLTQKGRELAPVILALMQWGDKHIKDGESALSLTDKRTGNPVKIGIVPKGGALPLRWLNYTPVDQPSDVKDG